MALQAKSAEERAAMMPEGYDDIQVMYETGWTEQELNDTHPDVIQRMMLYRAVRRAIENGTDLTFE